MNSPARELSSWGGKPTRAGICADFLPSRGSLPTGPFIPRGAGRSYGDAALGDHVVQTRHLNAFHSFDRTAGVVVCESGVSIGELIEVCLPSGWLPRVIPGTRFVTVGGAIAADVHGKNHHVHGAFSAGVEWLELLTTEGEIVRCSAGDALFAATCAGMGLTGLIQRAALRLIPAASAAIKIERRRCTSLAELGDLAENTAESTFSVAWLNLSGRERMFGAAGFTTAEIASQGPTEVRWKRPLPVPSRLAGLFMNDMTLGLANRFLERLEASAASSTVDLEPFFFPLDRIHRWNRLYRRGLLQYQFVLPAAASLSGIEAILARIRKSSARPYLSVWKRMGAENSNWLSFPMAGDTLALDFPRRPDVLRLFAELDRIVIDHGGRVYLAKDARLDKATFRAMYPRWERLAELREKIGLQDRVRSDMADRLGL